MSNSKNEFIEEKRKLLYWFTQWKEDDLCHENKSLDIKEISILLQNLGFRLEKNFEKALDTESCLNVENNILKVELTCPQSSLRSVLIKEFTTCKCPSDEVVNDGEFWSVSASAPSRTGSINSSNSSLLPLMTPAKSLIIKALLGRIILAINELESNDNAENSHSFLSNSELVRHRSLDALKGCESSTSTRLKRRPSWEVDPRTSPPTQTSSPVPSLCQSLSQVSLNSDKSNILVKNLEAIKKLVDETLEIAVSNNLTYTKDSIPTKKVSNIILPELNLNSCNRMATTPRKVLTPKKKLQPVAKEKSGIPAKISTLKRKIISTGTTATSRGTDRSLTNNTPSPNFIKKNILRSGELRLTTKPKIGKNTLLGRNTTDTPEAGTSGLQKAQLVKKNLTSSTSALTRKKF